MDMVPQAVKAPPLVSGTGVRNQDEWGVNGLPSICGVIKLRIIVMESKKSCLWL